MQKRNGRSCRQPRPPIKRACERYSVKIQFEISTTAMPPAKVK